MARQRTPSTPALRLLEREGVEHIVHTYAYVARGGATVAAAALGRHLHVVIKTLVFEDADGRPLLALMHGDAEVSTRNLARAVGTKRVTPCRPDDAERITGYKVGGISPMGTRQALPVYVERSILQLDTILVNAGSRGVLVELSPLRVAALVNAKPVEVARGFYGETPAPGAGRPTDTPPAIRQRTPVRRISRDE